MLEVPEIAFQLYFSHHLSRGGGGGSGSGSEAVIPQKVTIPQAVQCQPFRGCFSIHEKTLSLTAGLGSSAVKKRCGMDVPQNPQPAAV